MYFNVDPHTEIYWIDTNGADLGTRSAAFNSY